MRVSHGLKRERPKVQSLDLDPKKGLKGTVIHALRPSLPPHLSSRAPLAAAKKALSCEPHRSLYHIKQPSSGVKPKDFSIILDTWWILMILALSIGTRRCCWHQPIAPHQCRYLFEVSVVAHKQLWGNVQEIWTGSFSVVAYPHRAQLAARRYAYIFKPGSCKFIQPHWRILQTSSLGLDNGNTAQQWPREYPNCGNDQCNDKGANSTLPRTNRSHGALPPSEETAMNRFTIIQYIQYASIIYLSISTNTHSLDTKHWGASHAKIQMEKHGQTLAASTRMTALPHMGSKTLSPGCSSAHRAMAQALDPSNPGRTEPDIDSTEILATGAAMPELDNSPASLMELWTLDDGPIDLYLYLHLSLYLYHFLYLYLYLYLSIYVYNRI